MTKAKESKISSATIQSMEKTYERLLCLEFPKHVSRNEFIFGSSSNPYGQYNLYIQIVEWLISIIGKSNDTVILFEAHEYEDPNLTANNLLQSLRSLNFSIDYSVIKIKQPYGEAACTILDFLTEKAIDNSHIVNLVGIESDGDVNEDEEHIENIKEQVDSNVYSNAHKGVELNENLHEPNKIHNQMDIMEWRNELERVKPHLDCRRIFDKNVQTWKNAVSQLVTTHSGRFMKEMKASEIALERLCEDTSNALTDMESREREINDKFHSIATEYETISNKVESLQKERIQSNLELEEARQELLKTSKRLADAKAEVDEKGHSITDTSQLVKMKTVLNGMKSEIKTFDAEISMLEHTLLHKKMQLRGN